MKVHKKSWHYRLWRLGRENSRSEPRDLCRYFWHIALLKVLLPLAVVVAALAGVVAIAWMIWENPIDFAIIVTTVLGLIAFVIGVGFLVRKSADRATQERLGVIEKKEPGVVREYLSARKRKVCPLIEVVDD